MNDPCGNPQCDFYDRCPLRPGPLPLEYTVMASFTPPQEPSFHIDGLGIAQLNVHGPIGAATSQAAIQKLRGLHRVRGFYLCCDYMPQNPWELGLYLANI